MVLASKYGDNSVIRRVCVPPDNLEVNERVTWAPFKKTVTFLISYFISSKAKEETLRKIVNTMKMIFFSIAD